MSFMNITLPAYFAPLTPRRLLVICAFAFCGLLAVSIGVGYIAADRAFANTQQNNTQASAILDFHKMNAADRAITQRIRKSIHQDKSLSAYAPNIKIISQDGKVTLSGKTRSEIEKDYLQTKAAAVAGEENVTNQLQVASSE